MEKKAHLGRDESTLLSILPKKSSFSFIFTCNQSLSLQENLDRSKAIRIAIRNHGALFIKLESSIKINGNEYHENILYVGAFLKPELVEILKEFGEIFFIYKDDNEFNEYRLENNMLSITHTYDLDLYKNDYSSFLTSFLTELSMGSNRLKFDQQPEINYLHELIALCFNERVYARQKEGDENRISLWD